MYNDRVANVRPIVVHHVRAGDDDPRERVEDQDDEFDVIQSVLLVLPIRVPPGEGRNNPAPIRTLLIPHVPWLPILAEIRMNEEDLDSEMIDEMTEDPVLIEAVRREYHSL